MHHALQCREPGWSTVFDWDAEEAARSRRRFLGKVAGTGSFVLPIHFPHTTTGLVEGGATPPGSVGGTNRTGGPGYYGPCPPVGDVPHHYVAQVYALDLPPDALPAGLTRDALLAAIKDHVLAATSTVLRYGR